MKIKDAAPLLGLRPRPRSYGFDILTFDLPKDGTVEYAKWLHPRETKKVISQSTVDELRTFLSDGDVAVDIGAHTGDSTLPMALAVGKRGCVVALEPNPYVFPILEQNARLNPEKTNIVPLMFAATRTDGEFEFTYSDAGFCNGGAHPHVSRWRHGHAFTLRVQGRQLESFLTTDYPHLTGRIRFIKVDTEGCDYEVLLGLAGLISRQRPYIRAEVYKWTSREHRVALYQFLAARGYTIYRVEDDSRYRGSNISEHELMTWQQFDIFCAPQG